MGVRKIKGLPVYEARMDGKGRGIIRVSLVDAPAVESDFLAYGKKDAPQTYNVSSEELHRVFGVVLRADYPIYREDADGGGYYIVFRAEQIREFAQLMFKRGKQGNIDLNHDMVDVAGVEIVQAFIKDTAKGITPAGYEDIADGSLFCEYQVTDAEIWERVKAGEFKGFSVEIFHDCVPVMDSAPKRIRKNYSTDNMSKMNKIKEAIAQFVKATNEALAEYGRVATDNGTLVFAEEEIAEGVAVWMEDEDGNQVAVPDGEFTTDDKRVIVVADGKVAEIRDIVEEIPVEEVPAEQAEEMPAEEAPEAPAEEAPAEDEKDKRIAELEAENDALKARVAELEAKLAEPAGEPAHEAFKKESKTAPVADPFALLAKMRK